MKDVTKNITKNITRLHIAAWCHGIVLVLSVILVAYISIDTFRGRRISSDMAMFPLFTVYLVSLVIRFFKREQKAREEATETLPKENQPVS